MSLILAIDIDEVVVNTWPLWLDWANAVTGKSLSPEDVNFAYDLRPFFPEFDALDFWRQNYLYEMISPRPNCVKALQAINNMGVDIGFVSYCKAGHFASKCRFIKKHFPYYKFINATKEKGYTLCDIAIDDRNKHLNQFRDNVSLIKFETPYSQDVELNKAVAVVSNWSQVLDYVRRFKND